jgi:uncharacterized membrane protein YoaK (UPF0700 family)
VIDWAAIRVIASWIESQGRPAFPYLLALEAVLLLVVAATGLGLPPVVVPDRPDAVLVGMLAVAAMGVQNALGRISLRHLAATTVMTVNVTQAVIDAVDFMRGKLIDAHAGRLFVRTTVSIVAFALGALGGAWAVNAFSFACLLLPAGLLLTLSVQARHHAMSR